jgi:hypothetical protein
VITKQVGALAKRHGGACGIFDEAPEADDPATPHILRPVPTTAVPSSQQQQQQLLVFSLPKMRAVMNSGLSLLAVLAATMIVEFVQSQGPACEIWYV